MEKLGTVQVGDGKPEVGGGEVEVGDTLFPQK